MQRFYLPASEFKGDYAKSQNAELINQLTKVLRAKHGDKFGLFNGDGQEYLAQLTDLTKKEVKFILIDQHPGGREPLKKVTLYQSLLKKDKFDWLLQKAVEMGVYKIVPVISQYSIVTDLSPAKRYRYEEIIKEATEQCGGTVLPEIAPALKFFTAIEEAGKAGGAKAIAWEKESEYSIADIATDNIQLFIGPEGGFSNEEIIAAKNNQIVPVTLGRRILRAETAAIIALAKLL